MEVRETALPGVMIVEPRRFQDDRGFFCETWNQSRMIAAGFNLDFVQDNQSLNLKKGTVRGLHFQAPPKAQGKLVRCGRGAVWDVAVDIRRGSPTFGQWAGVELTAENGLQLYIPEGFLHGFSTLADDTELLYKCTEFYAPEADGSVRYDSPALGIDWRLDGAEALVSAKDAQAPDFDAFETPFSLEAV